MAFEHRCRPIDDGKSEQFGNRWQKRRTRPLRREIGRGAVAVDECAAPGKR